MPCPSKQCVNLKPFLDGFGHIRSVCVRSVRWSWSFRLDWLRLCWDTVWEGLRRFLWVSACLVSHSVIMLRAMSVAFGKFREVYVGYFWLRSCVGG